VQHEATTEEKSAEEHPLPEPEGVILIPEYSAAFRKHCATIPAVIAAEALKAVGLFAAHDPLIWNRTKPLERLRHHYRIRIGIHYRLILQWKSNETLMILDIIPRQDLESWIKRHA
ncbi:MAG: hypothetical protein HQL48_10995, partial [Gammaproteobacteria bacterium]|nr:hypothetical protein [Gammaproteobacteria bacterium]